MAGHCILLFGPGEPLVENGQLRLTYTALFQDPVLLPDGEFQTVVVYIDMDATPLQIENALEDAAIAAKDQFYPAMTLPRSGIIMHDIKRGSA